MTLHKTFEDAKQTTADYVTFRITDQLFGIPVLKVQDILGDFDIAPIPTSRDEIAGSLNLRGHIVTAIDVRKRLGLPPFQTGKNDQMSVVVEHENNLYSLIIDKVGDVIACLNDGFDKNPPTLDPVWQKICEGIFQLDEELLVIIDIPTILNLNNKEKV